MDIAERILDLRKKAGLSQEDLANKCDVSRQAVSKWESGQAMPDVEKILRLCEVFEVSADYLLRGEPEEKKEREKSKRSVLGGVLFGFSAISLLILLIVGSVIGGDYYSYDESANGLNIEAHGIEGFLRSNSLMWLPPVLILAGLIGIAFIVINLKSDRK